MGISQSYYLSPIAHQSMMDSTHSNLVCNRKQISTLTTETPNFSTFPQQAAGIRARYQGKHSCPPTVLVLQIRGLKQQALFQEHSITVFIVIFNSWTALFVETVISQLYSGSFPSPELAFRKNAPVKRPFLCEEHEMLVKDMYSLGLCFCFSQ